MRSLVSVLLLALLTLSAVAGDGNRDPAGYERILIPLNVRERPGAFGSLWQTELTMRNDADAPAHVFQNECLFFCTCDALPPCQTVEVPPKTTFHWEFDRDVMSLANYGAFVYVNRPRAGSFVAQLRVRDISRATDSWGTEVPVVRDADMRVGRTNLLDIPVAAGYRQHLRVYGASSPNGEGLLIVRAFGDDDALLGEREIVLQPGTIDLDLRPTDLPPDDELPTTPAYAELTSLRDLVGPSAQKIRLEIEPLTSGLKYWAMVSVTSNATHHVTLITPQ